MSKLTKELNSVAGIVGALGCNIAEAQKRLDLNYLDSFERLLGIAKLLVANTAPAGDGGNAAPPTLPEQMQALLLALAPSRYQYTETTITVKLNLAQGFDAAASVGVGAGFGAVAVNAALTVGYSFDYQAAAECRAVIHAVPPDSKTLAELLGRAKDLDASAAQISVPARSEVDTKIHERLESIHKKLPDIKLVADGVKKSLVDQG